MITLNGLHDYSIWITRSQHCFWQFHSFDSFIDFGLKAHKTWLAHTKKRT